MHTHYINFKILPTIANGEIENTYTAHTDHTQQITAIQCIIHLLTISLSKPHNADSNPLDFFLDVLFSVFFFDVFFSTFFFDALLMDVPIDVCANRCHFSMSLPGTRARNARPKILNLFAMPFAFGSSFGA